jgi:exonuclease SbcD
MEKRKPIISVSNDWHLRDENCEVVLKAIEKQVEHAKLHNINHLCILGDVFDSRRYQSQKVLSTFSEILNLFENKNIMATVIAGNHDKYWPSSAESFLTPFTWGRPHFRLIENCHNAVIDFPVEEEVMKIAFLPYFKEEDYLQRLQRWGETSLDVLFTHTAFQGSVNNDGTSMSSLVKPEHTKNFKAVFSGHYHNEQTIERKGLKPIVHLPSLLQNSFGEDEKKGFTVIYSDLDYEVISTGVGMPFVTYQVSASCNDSQFREFESVLLEKVKKYRVRLKILLDAPLKHDLTSLREGGVKVECVHKAIEATERVDREIITYSMKTLLEEWNLYCQRQEIDSSEGRKMLSDFILKS